MKDKKMADLEKRIEELEKFREDSRLSENALWESEIKYRTLFESLPDGLFHMVDIIIDCNKEACRIFGREKEEILGHFLSDFSPETQPDGKNSREEINKIINQVFKDTTKKFYWLFLKKDGSKIYCEVCLNRISIGGEDILQAIIRDVTERRNFIEQLKEKNQELENINIKLKEIVKNSKKVILRSKLDEIGKDILKEMAEKIMADGGSIFLVKEEGLFLLSSIDKGHTPERIPFPLKEGSIFERVLSTKNSVLIKNISEEKDFISSGWPYYKNGSLMAHPLFDERDEIIGIISLHNKQAPPFTQVDMELTSIVISNTWNNILDKHRV